MTDPNIRELMRLRYSQAADSGCLYCGSNTPLYELDHFPVPARHGGETTVRACRHCHNLKDRASDAVFEDYLGSIDNRTLNSVVLSPLEAAFVFGRASIVNFYTALNLIDDFPDLPPQIRVAAARNLARQFDAMQAG